MKKLEPSARAQQLLADLARQGLVAELFEKRGRSRRFVRSAAPADAGGGRARQAAAQEAGWALRAGDRRRSWFSAATGAVPDEVVLPEGSAHPVRLPDLALAAQIAAAHPAPWREPAHGDAPLVTESAAQALFAALERELCRELPQTRLILARLEEGTAESSIVTTSGLRAGWRSRAAWLRIEAEGHGRRCQFEGAAPAATQFDARRIALRLVERLSALAGSGESAKVAADRPLLLAAPLAARLLQAMAPVFAGPSASARLDALGALSAEFSLIDDGRFEEGVLAAPVDGEGLPTGRLTLVEQGRFVRPLLAWWEAGAAIGPGCARRAGWRDLPRRAPTHLFIPGGEVALADLLADGSSAAFLLDSEGPVRFDGVSLAFDVAVTGLRLEGGRAVAPLGPMRLSGDLRSFLAGIRHRAHDLELVPGDGMFGSPSLMVAGLRLSGGA